MKRAIPKFWATFTRNAYLCLCLCAVALSFSSQAKPASDVQTRFDLMRGFAAYTTWPSIKSPENTRQWKICVVPGDRRMDDFILEMPPILFMKLPLIVTPIVSPEMMSGCHVTYLPRAMTSDRMKLFTSEAIRQSVLTVSDSPGFSTGEGMIELLEEDGRYAFDIDYRVIVKSKLDLGSEALKMARRVR